MAIKHNNDTGAAVEAAAQNQLQTYSPEQVAKILVWHPESVRLAIRQGRIEAKRFGRVWRVTHAALTRILENGIPRLAE